MEDKDNYACYLDIPGGYHGHPYPQKFVKAPESAHPSKCPKAHEPDAAHVMAVTHGR